MFNKKLKLLLLTLFVLQFLVFTQNSCKMKNPAVKTQESIYNMLPGYGKKCWIGENYYFIYAFDKTPKMGTAILKIQLFDKNGKRNTDLNIIGNYGMPSMPGAHDSGEQSFKLNKKGDYLLPVDIAMPGEWEVKITFTKEKKTVYLGKFKFNV